LVFVYEVMGFCFWVIWFYLQSLGPESCFTSSMRFVGVKQSMDRTAIELTGSEQATVMQVTDEETGHKKFAYRFFWFWASKTDPKLNRNRSVWTGFGFFFSGLVVF